MKHSASEVLTSLISFFSGGTRKEKRLPKFRKALCFALLLSNILYPCATAKAWDFKYTVNDIVFGTPYYINENDSDDVWYDKSETGFHNCTSGIDISGSFGELQEDKTYRIYVKFTPKYELISYQDESGTNVFKGSTSADYYILVGGKRYDFGASNMIYFDVSATYAKFFTLGAEITTNYYIDPTCDYYGGWCYSKVTLEDVSYNIVEVTGYPDYSTAILDQTLLGANALLGSINTLSNNAYNELVKQSTSLTNIYTRLNTTNTYLNTIGTRINTTNSHLTNIDTKIGTTNSYLNVIAERALDIRNNSIFIANNTQRQNELTETQNSLIEQSNEYLEQIADGYDASEGNDSVSDFNGTIGDFESAQSDITDSASEYANDYTLNPNGAFDSVNGLGSAVSLASSMMQSVFVSFGEYGVIISIGIGLTIVTMLIGLSKFFVR